MKFGLSYFLLLNHNCTAFINLRKKTISQQEKTAYEGGKKREQAPRSPLILRIDFLQNFHSKSIFLKLLTHFPPGWFIQNLQKLSWISARLYRIGTISFNLIS